MKRTDVDFNKHVLHETHYTDPITGHNLDVWELKVPNTMWYRVIFINSCNTLTIDGDYGRFSFCREFHPSASGRVNDGYWLEKIICRKPLDDGYMIRYSLRQGNPHKIMTSEDITPEIREELESMGYHLIK